MKEKNTYNLIVTSLSTVSNPNDPNSIIKYYSEKDDIRFQGVMTNEASVKYVIEKLEKSGDCLDCIYYITTQRVMKYINNDNLFPAQTHEDFFRKQIDKFINEEKIKHPDYYKFPKVISDKPATKELVNLSAEILQEIIDIKEKHPDKEFRLYIDSNGGFRELMTIIIALLSTLASEDIYIEEIIGANLDKEAKECSIIDKTGAYQIYDFYSGIDEFINYGRSKKIKEFFDNTQFSIDDIKDVIDSINCMSDAFILCRPEKMLNTTKQLKNAIEEYNQTNANADQQLFSYLTRKIQKEYGEIFENINANDIYDYHTLKSMITYCLDHNLIQQALTIYSECMPNAIYDLEIIYPSEKTKEGFDIHYKNISKKTKKDYTKKYIFIQQYMLLDRVDTKMGKRTADGLVGKYCNIKKKNIKKYSTDQKLKALLDAGFICSNFKPEQVIMIMEHYLVIKNARNNSNHASITGKELENLSDLESIKEYINNALKLIDTTTNS